MPIIWLTIKSGGNNLNLFFSSLPKLRANRFFQSWVQRACANPSEYIETGSINDAETIYTITNKKHKSEELTVQWVFCE